MNNFWTRVLTGAVFLAVMIIGTLVIILLPILLLTIIILCLLEFYKILKKNNYNPQTWRGIILGIILFILATIQATNGSLYEFYKFLPIPVTWIISYFFLLFIIELFRNKPNPILNIALTLLGIIYIVVPIILLYAIILDPINNLDETSHTLILLGYFILIWSNDTFAYLVGRVIGKHKLFERISPKKTWEGTIGGLLFTQGMAYVISIYFTELAPIHWHAIALIVSVFGTLGDLVESMFKRSLGVKDSGTILPGHGGILDRFDGVLLSSPFVVTYLMLVR